MIARASSMAFDMFYSNYLTMGTRGGSSKLIERGSYRVKGASGVYTMRERRAGGLGDVPPEAEAFLLMNAYILTFWSNKISKKDNLV